MHNVLLDVICPTWIFKTLKTQFWHYNKIERNILATISYSDYNINDERMFVEYDSRQKRFLVVCVLSGGDNDHKNNGVWDIRSVLVWVHSSLGWRGTVCGQRWWEIRDSQWVRPLPFLGYLLFLYTSPRMSALLLSRFLLGLCGCK